MSPADHQSEPSLDASLDELDRRLLNGLQAGLPLIPEPFADLAASLGVSVDELLARIAHLKQAGIIRQLCAIFDTAAMGYASSLVAGRIDPARLPAAVERINRHPGVTHNYRRNHDYNLWFTLAVPPGSKLWLAGTVDRLTRKTGAAALRLMPALRVFKIGVQFDMTGEEKGDIPIFSERGEEQTGSVELEKIGMSPFSALSLADIAVVGVLQDDLPLTAAPFTGPARSANRSVEQLLAAAQRMQQAGQMRRLAAILHHRAAGFSANAMGVWSAEEDRVDEVGRLLASFRAVSHCYQRPTWPDWPFNLFTMVHGHAKSECEAHLAAMRAASGIERMAVLYSLEEYKKTRLRYFTGEIEAWEAGKR